MCMNAFGWVRAKLQHHVRNAYAGTWRRLIGSSGGRFAHERRTAGGGGGGAGWRLGDTAFPLTRADGVAVNLYTILRIIIRPIMFFPLCKSTYGIYRKIDLYIYIRNMGF